MVLFVQVARVAKRECRVQEENAKKDALLKNYERFRPILAKAAEII